MDMQKLAMQIRQWGQDLGFQQIGITDTHLERHEDFLLQWLEQDMHGEMEYMQRHGVKRSRPDELVPGTTRIITARMDYWPEPDQHRQDLLDDPAQAYISRYALGRDYHKLLRSRLQKLAEKIQQHSGPYGYRVFVDSAPVLEKALAEKSGLGWIGKHTNLINEKAGSWFFLGELFTDLPLPVDQPADEHCGTCSACIDICPTSAILAPYRLDARRCISYLTIELRGSIPVELRPMLGNRIYGCDDCQLVCPWNRFARMTSEHDFWPRHELDQATLVRLFSWNEEEFLKYTEGSAIRRIGYSCWLRNIAVALGNGAASPEAIGALRQRLPYPDPMVQEHVEWALQRLHATNC